MRETDWVWVRDDMFGYLPARVEKIDDKAITLDCLRDAFEDSLSTIEWKDESKSALSEVPAELLNRIQVSIDRLIPDDQSNFVWSSSLDDLVQLNRLSSAAILHNLRKRYFQNTIYTRISSVLIAINPYAWIPIYSTEYLNKFSPEVPDDSPDLLTPHVFGVSRAAVISLLRNKKDQSVLVSGESGAGKTEATKLVLRYLVNFGGVEEGGVETTLLNANPILEAFGNAKTLRNDNSSRFGRWTNIRFCTKQKKILGARLTSYLLESNRIPFQISGERNFHIFYQSCYFECKKNEEILPGLGKCKPEKFHYLQMTNSVIKGVDDEKMLQETLDAFEKSGFDSLIQTSVMKVVKAILYLGNISFSANEKGTLNLSEDSAKVFCELTGVDYESFMEHLLIKKLRIASQSDLVSVPMNKEQAIESRDALAKKIYYSLFLWLIEFINQRMSGTQAEVKTESDASSFAGCIGVLDVFGFESFEVNGIDQFLINFANERLHQHFLETVFKIEKDLYLEQGVDIADIKFTDNQSTLDLLAAKPNGILHLLHDEIFIPKSSHITFVKKIRDTWNGKSSSYISKEVWKDKFAIVHFAGAVVYNADDFIERNRNKLDPHTFHVVQQSKLEFFKDILVNSEFPEDELEHGLKRAKSDGGKKIPSKSKGSKQTSIGLMFSQQVSKLMTDLTLTESHFIRCIKPNSSKEPRIFKERMVLEQLENSGMLETVKVRKFGFPERFSFDNFLIRFGVLNRRARVTERKPSEKEKDTDTDENPMKRSPTKEDGLVFRGKKAKPVTQSPSSGSSGGKKETKDEMSCGKARVSLKKRKSLDHIRGGSEKERVIAMLIKYQSNHNDVGLKDLWRVGSSLVFLKTEFLHRLQTEVRDLLTNDVIKIQRNVRRFIYQRRYVKKKAILEEIRKLKRSLESATPIFLDPFGLISSAIQEDLPERFYKDLKKQYDSRVGSILNTVDILLSSPCKSIHEKLVAVNQAIGQVRVLPVELGSKKMEDLLRIQKESQKKFSELQELSKTLQSSRESAKSLLDLDQSIKKALALLNLGDCEEYSNMMRTATELHAINVGLSVSENIRFHVDMNPNDVDFFAADVTKLAECYSKAKALNVPESRDDMQTAFKVIQSMQEEIRLINVLKSDDLTLVKLNELPSTLLGYLGSASIKEYVEIWSRKKVEFEKIELERITALNEADRRQESEKRKEFENDVIQTEKMEESISSKTDLMPLAPNDEKSKLSSSFEDAPKIGNPETVESADIPSILTIEKKTNLADDPLLSRPIIKKGRKAKTKPSTTISEGSEVPPLSLPPMEITSASIPSFVLKVRGAEGKIDRKRLTMLISPSGNPLEDVGSEIERFLKGDARKTILTPKDQALKKVEKHSSTDLSDSTAHTGLDEQDQKKKAKSVFIAPAGSSDSSTGALKPSPGGPISKNRTRSIAEMWAKLADSWKPEFEPPGRRKSEVESSFSSSFDNSGKIRKIPVATVSATKKGDTKDMLLEPKS